MSYRDLQEAFDVAPNLMRIVRTTALCSEVWMYRV